MLFGMSDDKKSPVEPTVIIAATQSSEFNGEKKGRITKKHVLIAVIALLITGLIVTGALVGMRIYGDTRLEELKYTLQANGVTQNVTTDKNAVNYYVHKDGVDAWIIHDFDRELQISKVRVGDDTTCYVTALNRSMASDASSIPTTTPDAKSAPSSSVIYQVVAHQIHDISYLGKKASEMCKGIPTYHAIPDCGDRIGSQDVVVRNSTDTRAKRTPAFCATCNKPNCLCACGCCSMFCAWFASTQYYTVYVNGQWYCYYWYYSGYAYYYASLAYQGCRYPAYYGTYYNP